MNVENVAKTDEWSGDWDNFDNDPPKPLVDIIIYPKQENTGLQMQMIQNHIKGKPLQNIQEKIDYGCLYLIIADGLKHGWTIKKISSEVMRFMKDNGLTLHNFDDVSESRINDVVHGVKDCMRAKKSNYESNEYPCHRKHYDFGVWLYREFSKNDVFHAEVKEGFTTI